VCNNYLNINLDQESTQFFIFGSFCVGIVSICFPHIADSCFNIVQNVDLTAMYGQEVNFVNAADDVIMSRLSNMRKLEIIADMNMLKELGIVSNLFKILPNQMMSSVLTEIFNAQCLEKFYMCSVVIPHQHFEDIAMNSMTFGKYFLPFDPDIVAMNSENLRLYFLYKFATNLGLGNFDGYMKVLLDNMDLTVTRNNVYCPIDLILHLDEVADLQLIDSFTRGAGIGISSQEY